jgi:hypothetical protein
MIIIIQFHSHLFMWPGFEAGSGQVGFVVDKEALGQVFSEYFGFPCQSSSDKILHHHNHPGQVQYAKQWLTCRVGPAGLHPPLCEKVFIYVQT